MSAPLELSPLWPEVRCTTCGLAYTCESRALGANYAGVTVYAPKRCPRCGGERFNTRMTGVVVETDLPLTTGGAEPRASEAPPLPELRSSELEGGPPPHTSTPTDTPPRAERPPREGPTDA